MASRKSDPGPPVATPPMANRASLGHGSTATSSAAASPKPPKQKDPKDLYPAPPPLPGSGLMQLGGIGGPNGDVPEYRAPTVILEIPMAGESGKIINFTRMAEERYGWDALHPRLAARRDRLARVAASGAAIENNGPTKDDGGDESLDADSADEGSNVEMGGMSDGRTGTDGAKKLVRKRRMKEDEYDKDDGFVDDAELLWEEQAAVAADGFFVFSGPLVPMEKPALDLRADGAPKRGRGRGGRGGRGGTTRGASRVAELAASGVGINPRNGLPLSGPGSRGGSTTRKPRITKADRARMEQEKLEREKMGTMAPMPSGYNGMAQLASASSLGNTPMVFNQ
ncbi:hypothetical protein BJ875DRAFT_472577 [Amylocarpus encephaloides]|uniref:Hpc2-related domain-containing protein n=1 Tax=Amylocarpus encephaloides TaxID=45428 RepID=A0A9P7YBC1_9HELO|nr:hypothetical protein BJ875DRAFT_472577 [Amylocarpus encephaloides]